MDIVFSNETRSRAILRVAAVVVGIAAAAHLGYAASNSLQILNTALPSGVVLQPYSSTFYASGGTAPYTWTVASGSILPGAFQLSSSGVLTGAPNSTGIFSIGFQVTDANKKAVTKSFTLSIGTSGVVNTSLPSGVKGAAYNAALVALGGTAPYKWSLNNGVTGKLPSGLSLSSSGTIVGTPTILGYDDFTLNATDAKGVRFSQTLVINTVTPLVVSTSTLPSGTMGHPYKSSLGASGGTGPYQWKVVTGTPPSIIGVDTTGNVAGTPTVSGSFGFTVQASDTSGQKVNAPLSMVVTPPLVISTTSLPGGTVGATYSAALAASGGITPYAWRVAAGALSPGLTLNSAGTISGTPTSAGSSSFTLQATDALGSISTQAYTITVAAPPLSITTTSLPNGTVGTAYSASLSATGGIAPYLWTVSAGALPAGVGINSGGSISGTPTTAGTSSFTLKVIDSTGTSITRAYSVAIVSGLSVTTTSLPNGTTGVAYSAAVAATGGTPPYAWAMLSGILPAGLSLSAAGSISGTPTATGSQSFTIAVTDAAGSNATRTLSLNISSTTSSNLKILTNNLQLGYLNQSFLGVLSGTGGTIPYTWSVSAGQLPPGLVLSGTGQVSGTPVQGGQYGVTVTVSDATGANASQNFNVQVFDRPTDAYGGLQNLPCPTGPQAHFYTQKIASRWHLCTPAGNAFFLTGVYNVNGPGNTSPDYQGVVLDTVISSKYPTGQTTNSTLNWCLQTLQRLRSWGFNTLSETANFNCVPVNTDPRWGTPDNTIPDKMGFVVMPRPSTYTMTNVNNWASGPVKDMLFSIKRTVYTGYVGTRHMVDFWDNNFSQWLDGQMVNDFIIRGAYAGPNNSYLIGFDIDETDNLMGFGAGPDFPTIELSTTGAPEGGHTSPHLGWLVLVTSPVQTANNGGTLSGSPVVYSDKTVYTKQQFSQWLSSRYGGNIANLNTAWGSNYTTFGSTASSLSTAIGTGNGSVTKFTSILANTPVTPYTVAVKVGGIAVAGDGGDGNLYGSVTLSTINYATGALSVTFNTPPVGGAAVTVEYQKGGFGAGTGVLDEDGTCPSKPVSCWIPADFYALTGAPPAMQQDLNDFLLYDAQKYYSSVTTTVRNRAPGVMIFGSSPLGAYGTPPFRQILQAAGQYLDVITFGNIPPFLCATCTDAQQRIDYAAQWGGDKPWLNWTGFQAKADSYMSPYAQPTDLLTQQATRGQAYQQMLQQFLNAKDTATGTYHIVGLHWWELYDNTGEQANWGLITRRDDPYDGLSSTPVAGVDGWGYPTGCFSVIGCEKASYSDFLGYVRNANLAAFSTIASGQ